MSSGLPVREKLTNLQILAFIICFVIGAELFVLPREAVASSHSQDAWLSILLGGGISFTAAWIMIALSRRYPDQSFYEFVQSITGKALGKSIGVLVVVYYIHLAGYEMRSMKEVTSFYLLEGTPGWAISALFLWISLYVCMEGFQTLGYVCQIIFPITIAILFLIFLLGFNIFDVQNLRPVLSKGVVPVLHGLKSTGLTFSGSECLLFLLCRMEKPEKAGRIMGLGIGMAAVFYSTAVILCIGAFTVDGVMTRTWPFFDLSRSVEVKFLLLERFESFLLAIWIMQIFAIFSIVFSIAALGLTQIMKISRAKSLYVLLPVIYLISQLPKDMSELIIFGGWIGKAHFALFSCMPIFLFMLSRWRSKTK